MITFIIVLVFLLESIFIASTAFLVAKLIAAIYLKKDNVVELIAALVGNAFVTIIFFCICQGLIIKFNLK